MSGEQQNGHTPTGDSDAEFVKAFKELQKGEQTAAALENHLDSIEKKIEELLAQADKAEQEMKARSASKEEKPSQSEEKDS